MPAPQIITPTNNVHNGSTTAAKADLVTLTDGGRVVTHFNWSAARMYVLFDPVDTTVIPGANVQGSKVIPPGNDRTFLRGGQNRPILVLVAVEGGGVAEYTIDSETQ